VVKQNIQTSHFFEESFKERKSYIIHHST